jgi:hypothetical protein
MKKIVLIFLSLFLFSCSGPNNTQSNNSSNNTFNSASKTVSLSIKITNGHNNEPIKDAEVKLVSTNGINKTLKTNENGISFFTDIIENNFYDIEVTAKDFVSNKTNLKVDSSNKEVNIKLYKNFATLKGTIVSENDIPVESAVIKVGNNFTLSDKDGNFSININSLDKIKVEIFKNGFSNLKTEDIDFSKENNKDLGKIKLSQLKRKVSVFFDNRTNLLTYLDKLNDLLVNFEYEIKKGNFYNENLDNIDILVLVCPNFDYNSQEIMKLQSFIRIGGKKIIILGEWGGYSYFYSNSINTLLKEFNLKINQDLVRDNADFTSNEIITKYIQPHYVTRNVSSLSFYSSSSLEIFKGGINELKTDFTKSLVYTSSNGFKIQQYTKGQQSLLAVSLAYGTKLVLIGDTSLFTSDDSNYNGISNIDESDNKTLALNIFSW